MSVLGIDLGTTGTKAIVFNCRGQILSGKYIEYDTTYIKEGWIELDPTKVLDSAIGVIKAVSKDVSKKDPVEAVGISCLGAVVIPLDKSDNYLYNGMTFMDCRTVDNFEKKVGMNNYNLYKITGIPPNPFFTLSKILWLKENKKDIFQSVKRFYSFKELLLMKMGVEPKNDHSMASSTMMYDLDKSYWSEEIFENIGINIDQFPQIVDSWDIIGEINDKYAEKILDICINNTMQVGEPL